MLERPQPVLRMLQKSLVLQGIVGVYASQAELVDQLPQQWAELRTRCPGENVTGFYGASPCTDDGKIHFLAGVPSEAGCTAELDSVVIEAGEYAFMLVEDTSLLRETWSWLLGTWLPASGRTERNAPEFERYAGISGHGQPIAPVEIWIPLES